MWRVAVLSVLILAGLVPGITPAAPAGSFQFAAIDISGAISTLANGINNGGTVVGSYRDATGIHGFSRDADGTYHPLDVHNAIFTLATALSDDGHIVGIYQGEDRKTHGFIQKTSPRPIDVPGAEATCASGINRTGQIVGSFGVTCPDGKTQGFLMSRGTFSPAIVFSTSDATAISTSVSGINDAGQIVGRYTDSGGTVHGFALVGGAFTAIDVPGAAATSARGINNRGQVVGDYKDADGATHGFVLTGTQWLLPIDYPRDVSVTPYTQLNGINDAGHVVGVYLGTDGLFHGFLAVLL